MASKNDEKIIFKCDKHSAIIFQQLQSFYFENEFFDTVLIAGNNCVHIQAHRVVLCALSEFILKIFRESQSALKGNVVELKEIEASTLKLVIDFMYSGEIELSLGTVEGLLRTASFLKLKTLIDGCCDLIESNINNTNSLYWLRLAKELSLPTLKLKSLECYYIHFEKISKDEEFLMLSEIELKDLLFNDNPHGDFEEEIFLSVVSWINYDKPNREHLVFELLSMVRFWVLTPKFIVENRKSVCKTVESYELICSWLQWHLSPETRSNDQPNTTFKPRKKPNKLAIVRSYYNDNRDIRVEIFNSEENSWSIGIEKCLSTKKSFFTTIVIDGKLIVFGGLENSEWTNTVECLDLRTLEWSNLPPMIRPLVIRCKLADLNGYYCVLGQSDYDYACGSNSSSIEVYNFSTCQWYRGQPLNQPNCKSEIAGHNGLLYILDFNNGYLQIYDASTNEWTSRTIKKDLVQHFGFAATEEFLYVIGGCDDCEDVLKTVHRYDLFNDTWCEMASIPQAMSFVKTQVFGNKIIACDSFSVVEYCIDTDKWNTLCPISKCVGLGAFDIFNFNH